MTDIKGRTAFITGGANGIGLGIARSLANEGAKLALVDLDAAALERAKAELQSITQVETYILDVRDRAAYAATGEAVERDLGPVTLLFNNAGVAGYDSVRRLTYELWDWYININLYGVINGLMTFMPKMLERGQGGHIVNTASGAGLVASGAGILYTTSKYAVVGMSEELRINSEIKAAGIGVSVLCPNRVATGIVKRTLDATPQTAKVPLPEAYEKVIAEALESAQTALLNEGVPIDVVGEMVLKAVKENKPYIITDRAAEDLIKNRFKAQLEALPD